MSSPIPRPSTPLLKRRKAELIELALSLGLSGEGSKEIVLERIRNYISNYGTSDTSLSDLVGKDDQDSGLELQTDRDDDERRQHHVKDRPTTSSVLRRASNTSRAVMGTKGFQLHDAISGMQDELLEAMELARDLQETLVRSHASNRRSSPSSQSASRRTQDHDSLSQTKVSGTAAHRENSSAGRRPSHTGDMDDDSDLVECGYLKLVLDEWKRFFGQLGGVLGFTTSDCNIWTKLHDVGSTTTGLVWLTLLLELGVFLREAMHKHDSWQQGVSIWTQLPTVTTDWAGFLRPFFVFYGTLFLIPTVLSQIVSMDRPRLRHENRGVLSSRPTAGLSYFVLRFAIAYLLSRGNGSLWDWTNDLKETFRYVPYTLVLVTSGVGSILSLASLS